MNKKTLALSGLALGSMMALGCGDPAPTTDAGPMVSDTGPGMDPISQTYIVGAISIPAGPDAMNRVPGFNLDGMVNDGTGVGCVAGSEDFTSFSAEAGTDNVFVGSLVATLNGFLGGTGVQGAVDEQIASGALLLAMRVNDINSFASDSSVTLELFLVRQADCAMSPCAVTGSVMAGQAWRQDAVSLTPTPLSASISAGQLRGTVAALPLSFTVSDTPVTLTIRSANVGAGISATGLTNGAIGGSLLVADIVALAMPLAGGADVSGIIGPFADLDPMAGDPNTCSSISIGLGFTAVPALSVAPL